MENKEPRAACNDSGWHHTPTAEAVRARLVAALMLRPSARKRKAVMNVLKPEKKLAVIAALTEGNSIRSIERMTGIHRDTIMRLLLRTGENCAEIMDQTMRNLRMRYVQVDELWTFCFKKQARLSYEERFSAEMGDQYVFFAIDAESKLVPHFEVGKRNMATAYRMMDGLRVRLANGFQLTTDAFVPYLGAVERAWGADAPHFAQLVKRFGQKTPGPARYAPAEMIETIPTVVWGSPDPRYISTSYIERANLTVRMACRRFTRLVNAFSKRLENLKAALALHFAWYNFVRIHRSLRVTPAMAAAVTDRAWDLEELLV